MKKFYLVTFDGSLDPFIIFRPIIFLHAYYKLFFCVFQDLYSNFFAHPTKMPLQ